MAVKIAAHHHPRAARRCRRLAQCTGRPWYQGEPTPQHCDGAVGGATLEVELE